ncbi:hypothetical protein D3C76_1585450 [compost metagenome]
MPAGFLRGRDGRLPAGRIADANGGRNRLRLQNRLAFDDGHCAFGFEADHPRQGSRFAAFMIFLEAFPVGGNVTGVADRNR